MIEITKGEEAPAATSPGAAGTLGWKIALMSNQIQ